MLDEGVGSDEGIVLACELLDQLLVLVELLQIVRRHGVNTAVLGTIDIMLVTEDAIPLISPDSLSYIFLVWVAIPDGHARAGNDRQTNGSGETLITLGIVVLEADLKFDGFEEVSLLGLERVFKDFLDVATHSGCIAGSLADAPQTCAREARRSNHTDCDFRRHDDSLPIELLCSSGEDWRVGL